MTIEEKDKLYRKIILYEKHEKIATGWLVGFGMSKHITKYLGGVKIESLPHTVGIVETIYGDCLLVEVEDFTYAD